MTTAPWRLLGALLIALFALAGCGDGQPATAPTATPPPTPTSTPTGTPQDDGTVLGCSAEGMDTAEFTAHPDLTGAANETRRDIAAAAAACDFDGLAALTAEDFSYSFGDGADPAGYWREQEARGEPVLRILVTLLGMNPHVREPEGAGDDAPAETVFTWPRVFQDDTPEARAELEAALGPELVADAYAPEGYLGWRAGIAGDGRWIFFVAGD
jgi:hypothetical protein